MYCLISIKSDIHSCCAGLALGYLYLPTTMKKVNVLALCPLLFRSSIVLIFYLIVQTSDFGGKNNNLTKHSFSDPIKFHRTVKHALVN